MRIISFLLFIFPVILLSQTNPEPFNLSESDYSFMEWGADEPAGTYPESMIFHQTEIRDPGLDDEMDSDWTLAYDLPSRARVNGLGNDGISFLNTSSPQEEIGLYMGAAVISLNTLKTKDIKVSWTAGTISPEQREYSIAFQYRTGSEGDFITTDKTYVMNGTAGHSEDLTFKLPEATNNQQEVQLRWKYFYSGTNTGRRAELRLDNIFVTSESATDVYFSDIENDITLSISPHPITDKSIIKISNLKCNNLKISAFNLYGQKLVEEEAVVNINEYYIPAGDLNLRKAGVYILQVASCNDVIIKKLITIK